jgi:hypothetical protein
MEQSPSWEANQFAASQEIPRILWNLKVHYRTHNFPPPVIYRPTHSIVCNITLVILHPNFGMYSSFPPHIVQVLHVTPFLIHIPQYLKECQIVKFQKHNIFSVLLSLPHSWNKVSPTTHILFTLVMTSHSFIACDQRGATCSNWRSSYY